MFPIHIVALVCRTNMTMLVHPQKPTFIFLYTHAFFMKSVKAPESHLIILPVSDDWYTQSICPSFLFSLFLMELINDYVKQMNHINELQLENDRLRSLLNISPNIKSTNSKQQKIVVEDVNEDKLNCSRCSGFLHHTKNNYIILC
jgi:hypothetical protein